MVSGLAYVVSGELRGHHAIGSLATWSGVGTFRVLHHSGRPRIPAQYRSIAGQFPSGHAAFVDTLVHVWISTWRGYRYQPRPSYCQRRRLVRSHSSSKHLVTVGTAITEQTDYRPYPHPPSSHPELDRPATTRYR